MKFNCNCKLVEITKTEFNIIKNFIDNNCYSKANELTMEYLKNNIVKNPNVLNDFYLMLNITWNVVRAVDTQPKYLKII